MTDEEKAKVAEQEAEAQERFEALQKNFNSQKEELEKAKQKAVDQEKRAKKAERDAKGKTDPAEVDEWKQKFEIEHEKNVAQEKDLIKLAAVQKNNSVMEAVAGFNDYTDGSSANMAVLINAQSKMDNGKVVITDSVGQIRLNKKTLQPMTAKDLRNEILNNTPSMVKAKTDGGSGSHGNDKSGNATMNYEELKNKSPAFISKYRSGLSGEEKAALDNHAKQEV